jgi:pyroglutamyl-peptidase
LAEGLVLEKVGQGHDYTKDDVKGCKPCNHGFSQNTIYTKLDVDHVCQRLNQCLEDGLTSIPSATSRDAGRYLCEYIYYKSLQHNPEKVVFIHVPEEKKYSVEEVAKSLQIAVQCLLDQVQSQVIQDVP